MLEETRGRGRGRGIATCWDPIKHSQNSLVHVEGTLYLWRSSLLAILHLLIKCRWRKEVSLCMPHYLCMFSCTNILDHALWWVKPRGGGRHSQVDLATRPTMSWASFSMGMGPPLCFTTLHLKLLHIGFCQVQLF